MRYVVIGAGAVGSALSGLLARRNRSVLLIGQGDHAAAVRNRGLTTQCPDTTFTVCVPVASAPDQVRLQVDDVLVLTMKAHQTAAAVRQWADAPVYDDGNIDVGTAAGSLPILTASKGVSSEGIALRWFNRVYAVCIWCPVVMAEPGKVTVQGAPLRGIFHIGRYGTSTDPAADEEFLDQLGEDWDDADCLTRLPADVMSWKYRKLLADLRNAVDAMVHDPGAASDLTDACQSEAEHVLQVAGFTVVPAERARVDWNHEGLTVQPVPDFQSHHGSPTWQSPALDTRTVETDYLNGEIARLGRLFGVPTPVNSGLTTAARQATYSRRPPGSTPTEFRTQLYTTGDIKGGRTCTPTKYRS